MTDDQLTSLANLEFPGAFPTSKQRPPAKAEIYRDICRTLRTLASLSMEGMALYRPLPEAAKFHACTDKYVTVEGSNRSGKTEAAAIEMVRAVCGCDPYDKYPKKNGVAIVVGLKEDNISMLWRKMAQPGSYKLVRDEHTKLYRAVRPDPNDPLHLDPYDLAYQEKWIDAPPLLPPRLVNQNRDVAWGNRALGVPRMVKVPTTGWRIEMRPSGSPPDQGDHYNFVLNDEEMLKADWYDEEVRGLTGLDEPPHHRPRLIWSATSQVANPAFARLRNQALDNVPGFARFSFLIKDNPYVPDAEKRMFWEGLRPDERPTRYYGIPAAAQRAVYGEFDMKIHGYDHFEIPEGWTRYAVVDPGTTVCATLLAAVDPDEKHIWVYGCIELRKAEHIQWATELKRHERGVRFEAIVMDSRAGSQRSFNNAHDTSELFATAMKVVGLRPRITGSMAGFIPSQPDIKSRVHSLRNCFAPRPYGPFEGTPRLQLSRGKLPSLEQQIKEAMTSLKDPEKRDKQDKQTCDSLDCCEYLAAYDPHYHQTEPASDDPMDSVVDRWERKQQKRNRQPQNAGFTL